MSVQELRMKAQSAASDRFTWPARLALLGVLGLAAGLRLWHLDQNGYGRQYYGAGVRSMLGSFHNFFFNTFDPAGFVSLDKPPLALWLQVASAKLMGFSAFSVMLPQVLEGLFAVVLVHKLVRRRFGDGAALVAALFLALTPISVAVDRSNNTDSCLTLVLLLAVWAVIHATEAASVRLLVLAMALVGIGFNVKMAAALVVAPTFVLAYLLGAHELSIRQRLTHIAVSVVVMLIVSLSWVTIFDLTPSTERPYAGSTEHNSMLELAVLHNGLDRFVHRSNAAPSDTTTDSNAPDATVNVETRSVGHDQQQSGPARSLWDQAPTGALRLLTPFHAAQMAWWLPLALVGVALGALSWRRGNRLAAEQSNLLAWAGWALSYGILFSFAGGVIHTYYFAVLAPPLAALSGIGWAALWRRYRDRSWRPGLPLALLLIAAWQLYIAQEQLQWPLADWRVQLLALSITGLMAAGIGMLMLPRRMLSGRVPAALAGLGLLAALVLPTAWALSTVLVRPNVAAPAANLAVFSGASLDAGAAQSRLRNRARLRRLIGFLKANRAGERFLVAVPNALQAAPIIVATGEAVMAMGGYLGHDPILTPDKLERLVQGGDLRFVMLGGFALGPANTVGERALARWIADHGVPVDPALWRGSADGSDTSEDGLRATGGPAQLYDLRMKAQ